MATPEQQQQPRISLGVDLGAATTRVSLLDVTKPMPVIVRNELSNEATSTVVSYPNREARCYGENAASKQITKAPETVVDLAPWLFGSASYGSHLDINKNNNTETAARKIGMNEQHPAQVAAFFLKSVLGFVPGDYSALPVCVSAPTCSLPVAAVALRQACVLAGIPKENTIVAPSDEAMAVYFHHLQYQTLSDEKPVHVTIIDVGQSCVSACVLAVTKTCIEKLGVESLNMGSGYIDAALCSYAYQMIEKKHGDLGLQGDVKVFRKVLRECRKAKEMLSTTDETNVQIEGLKGDFDVTVHITRAQAEESSAPFLRSLEVMLTRLKQAIPPAEDAPIETRVEVIGGGWRAPYVAEIVKKTLGVTRLGVSLDANLAVSEGSAILAELCCPQHGVDFPTDGSEPPSGSTAHPIHNVTLRNFTVSTPGPVASPLSGEDEGPIAAWAAQEAKLAAVDSAIHARLASINRLDSYVLQTLDAVDKCSAERSRKDAASQYLYTIDEYVRDCDEISMEDLDAKLAEVRAHVEKEFPEVEQYYATVRAEEKRKDEELTKLSQMQKEEDADLKSDPQRLRMAQKRREQGQELFKQECWQEAQTRFVQALSALGQLYDTNDADNKAKKNEISLSCHLNIASCSVKLNLWRNAVSNCTQALDISPNNAKALFRRGQSYAALKEYAEAVKDLEQASALTGGDAAVVAELARAKQLLDGQKAKEKKMFSKMFS